MITIYIICWNEELLLPHTVSFYRQRFPGCKIVVYDNFSTDNTVMIAELLKCEVKHFYTGDKMSDEALISIKNNCWKDAETDWVMVIDTDEWMDVYAYELQLTKATVLRSKTIQMVSIMDRPIKASNPLWMVYGVIYDKSEGKFLCFRKSAIKEMNYDYGCHTAEPWGEVIFSERRFNMFHYKWLSLEYVINRHALVGKRLPKKSIRMKWSIHYLYSKRRITREYRQLCKLAKRVL